VPLVVSPHQAARAYENAVSVLGRLGAPLAAGPLRRWLKVRGILP